MAPSSPRLPLHLGLLASHGGSKLQAILDAIDAGTLPAKPCIVICNNSEAQALARAARQGIPALHLSNKTHPSPEALDAAILEALLTNGVNLVVLAGYMKKLGPRVLTAYAGRVLNIHPALLPKFGGQGMYGMRVHSAVIAAGEAESGPTVHVVTAEYDAGPVLAQARVPVMPGDTAETLQARVLVQEHRLYPDVLRRIALGEITLASLQR